MASSDGQLKLLLKIEQDKEAHSANELKSAQSYLVSNQGKLKDVEAYKLEYLSKLQAMGDQGVIGSSYQHYQRFIVQLERGIEQQLEVIKTAQMVVEQRKQQWLAQQKKVRSVQLLLDKRQKEHEFKLAKQEQAIADDFALQKFIRAKLVS
jgi:flagellar FliJ protein